MKRRCSWCQSDLEPNDAEPKEATTYTACKVCSAALLVGRYVMPHGEFKDKTLDEMFKTSSGKIVMKMHMHSSVPDGFASTTDAIRTFLKGCNRCVNL